MDIERKRKTITFRDGSTLSLVEGNWVRTMLMVDLENAERKRQVDEAIEDPDIVLDPLAQKERDFRLYAWPKLLGSVDPSANGHTPILEDVLDWPSAEVMKWYEGAKEVNPDWFTTSDDDATVSPDGTPLTDAQQLEAKKKEGKSG